jgi:WD40 repeat protein
VWNAATGQVIAKLEGHSDVVRSAAFSPDGQRVVTASYDHTARVWNAATGQVIAKLEGSGSIFSAAFSPDGQRILTAGTDQFALIFKIVTLDDIVHLLASK